jgi:hypothetical protein
MDNTRRCVLSPAQHTISIMQCNMPLLPLLPLLAQLRR